MNLDAISSELEAMGILPEARQRPRLHDRCMIAFEMLCEPWVEDNIVHNPKDFLYWVKRACAIYVREGKLAQYPSHISGILSELRKKENELRKTADGVVSNSISPTGLSQMNYLRSCPEDHFFVAQLKQVIRSEGSICIWLWKRHIEPVLAKRINGNTQWSVDFCSYSQVDYPMEPINIEEPIF